MNPAMRMSRRDLAEPVSEHAEQVHGDDECDSHENRR
jgi:hypothetical protein